MLSLDFDWIQYFLGCLLSNSVAHINIYEEMNFWNCVVFYLSVQKKLHKLPVFQRQSHTMYRILQFMCRTVIGVYDTFVWVVFFFQYIFGWVWERASERKREKEKTVDIHIRNLDVETSITVHDEIYLVFSNDITHHHLLAGALRASFFFFNLPIIFLCWHRFI